MPRVRISGRSHNPADPFIPRFDLRIPLRGSIEAELTPEQVAWLQSDPWLIVEVIGYQSEVVHVPSDAGGSADAGKPARPSIRSKRR